jgi:chromosome segregation ATPase
MSRPFVGQRWRLEEQQRAMRLAQERLDEVHRDLAVATRRVERLQEERREAEARLMAAADAAGYSPPVFAHAATDEDIKSGERGGE